jgi:two-component system sensor histidine kinase YesM
MRCDAILSKKTPAIPNQIPWRQSPPALISPLFICNLLTALSGLNRMGERKRLEKALYSLSRVFYYLDNQASLVTLRSEFDFLEAYLSLQKIRFGENLAYSLVLDEKESKTLIRRYALFVPIARVLFENPQNEPPPEKVTVNCVSRVDGSISIQATMDGEVINFADFNH